MTYTLTTIDGKMQEPTKEENDLISVLKEKQQNIKVQIEALELELKIVNSKIYWIENPQGDF